jgi:trans-2,3-dihydro-3-hydroxyanthranilate isomerase
MFAPLAGTWEDPATGSANAALAALLLSLGGEDKLELQAVQGVEMGRPSMLFLRAWRAGDEIRSAVAGRCVPVFSGTVTL